MRNTDIIKDDMFNLVTGRFLGGGCFRDVYECSLSEDLVVKVAVENSFHNIFEWDLWTKVSFSEYSKWFAPCVMISENGKILIQKKTEGVPYEMLPKFIPVFMTDTKKENWGLYNGSVVCHDYGYTTLVEDGLSKKVKIADWR